MDETEPMTVLARFNPAFAALLAPDSWVEEIRWISTRRFLIWLLDRLDMFSVCAWYWGD